MVPAFVYYRGMECRARDEPHTVARACTDVLDDVHENQRVHKSRRRSLVGVLSIVCLTVPSWIQVGGGNALVHSIVVGGAGEISEQVAGNPVVAIMKHMDFIVT